MASLYRIDVSSLQTYEERYAVYQKFNNGNWDIYDHWEYLDSTHRTFSYFDVFWYTDSTPSLPELPPAVRVIKQ
ncbi:MAG: hypothetical protein Q4C60_09535 [Eubacteriales bacterium]|nr:hypothetical protein [Eubacteriales bacterium]